MVLTTPKYNTETEGHPETATAPPAVIFDENLKEEILGQIREEGTVIVHCSYTALLDEGIRIWNSTVLVDRQSGSRSRLLHAENIPVAPVWMQIWAGTTARFTLIFAPLPKTCELFDLFEDIPLPGAFHIRDIRRNKSDVYRVTI